MASSAITLSVVATGESSVTGVHVGTSGWSYPSWKPGFYPAGTDSKEFLRFYAERFSTVELNTTGYRLPGQEQFERWAAATPAGFTFAPKLAGNRPRLLADFGPRVLALGEKLGPIRVQLISARDEGMIELILGSLDPGLRLAFDLAHPSWDGIERRLATAGAVRVNDLEHETPFRYVRFREPPYDDEALREWAATAPRRRRPALRVFPARGRADRAGVCTAVARAAARLVDAALLVDSDDGVEESVLLLLVRNVGRVVPVEVVKPRHGDADVGCHARADRIEPVLRPVAWAA